ncbi:hypothetical protein [Saccharicrinis sp. FJH54]|uniref:hypothetical protein n=1 Tax=Saccharicrinis sp. FJH54 TaxID=3344665 RepID=UPI0035D3E8B6
MRIKYYSTYSLDSDRISMNDLSKEIKTYLKNKNADNVESTRNKIVFNNRKWKWGSNAAYMTTIKKGTIELYNIDKKVEIRFTAFIDILTDIVLIIGLLLVGIFLKKIIIAFSVMIFLQLLYRLISARNRSEDFLNEMIDKIITN